MNYLELCFMGGSISGQTANPIAHISYPVLAGARLEEYIPVPEDTVRERLSVGNAAFPVCGAGRRCGFCSPMVCRGAGLAP